MLLKANVFEPPFRIARKELSDDEMKRTPEKGAVFKKGSTSGCCPFRILKVRVYD
jgi:hypothetical protein